MKYSSAWELTPGLCVGGGGQVPVTSSSDPKFRLKRAFLVTQKVINSENLWYNRKKMEFVEQKTDFVGPDAS